MRIKAAAIKHNGEIYTLKSPARHADIMRKYGIIPDVYGFLTDEDFFLNRSDAMIFALVSGQVKSHKIIAGIEVKWSAKELYSEDLW